MRGLHDLLLVAVVALAVMGCLVISPARANLRRGAPAPIPFAAAPAFGSLDRAPRPQRAVTWQRSGVLPAPTTTRDQE